MDEKDDEYCVELSFDKNEMPMIFIHKDEPRIHICCLSAKYDKVFTWRLHVEDRNVEKKE